MGVLEGTDEENNLTGKLNQIDMKLTEEQIQEYGRQYEELNRRVFNPRDGIFDSDIYKSRSFTELITAIEGMSPHNEIDIQKRFDDVKSVIQSMEEQILNSWQHRKELWKLSEFDKKSLREIETWTKMTRIISSLLDSTNIPL